MTHIVVLIPVYKHSCLVAEAIQSVIEQKFNGKVDAIVINDGCPYDETHIQGLIWAHGNIEVRYRFKRNGGPGSSRNAGMAMIEELGWSPDAVFFLDSDNRLSQDTLAVGWQELSAEGCDVGWLYPNIDAFEVEWYGDYTVPYSRLLHCTFGNLCDTGSLVKYSLARKIAFNEERQSGYEDWDYWLSAVALGFVGKNSANMHLYYRSRAESRVKEFKKSHSAVIKYLRDRYRYVFTPKKLVKFEHDEAPRFAHFVTKHASVHLFSDPRLPGVTISIRDALNAFIESHHLGTHIHFPEYIIISIEELKLGQLDRSFLWNLQCKPDSAFPYLSLVTISLSMHSYDLEPDDIYGKPADVVICLRSSHVFKSLLENTNDIEFRGIDRVHVISEKNGHSTTDVMLAITYLIGRIKKAVRLLQKKEKSMSKARLSWRSKQFPDRRNYYLQLEKHLTANVIYPICHQNLCLDVAFAVTFASFGGSEKVAYAVARVLRLAGYKTHLFVLGGGKHQFIDEFCDAFDSINLISDDHPAHWGGSSTGRGVEFATDDDPSAQTRRLVGLLCTMDVVINCQCASLNAAIADLRALGISTYYYIHLMDKTPFFRDTGHPMLTMLFEHVYDGIICCSVALSNTMHALGISTEKIFTISNRPSFTHRGDHQRYDRRSELQVLYLGRLDAQKGIERVVRLAELLATSTQNIQLRLVGANLIESELSPMLAAATAAGRLIVEAPVYETEALSRVFNAADVLILPSRWEGAPLVILEAQSAGLIPIATNVGAVAELIIHGTTGFLIDDGDDEQVVKDIYNTLSMLEREVERRVIISRAAVASVSKSSWEESVKPFKVHLDRVKLAKSS